MKTVKRIAPWLATVVMLLGCAPTNPSLTPEDLSIEVQPPPVAPYGRREDYSRYAKCLVTQSVIADDLKVELVKVARTAAMICASEYKLWIESAEDSTNPGDDGSRSPPANEEYALAVAKIARGALNGLSPDQFELLMNSKNEWQIDSFKR